MIKPQIRLDDLFVLYAFLAYVLERKQLEQREQGDFDKNIGESLIRIKDELHKVLIMHAEDCMSDKETGVTIQ